MELHCLKETSAALEWKRKQERRITGYVQSRKERWRNSGF